MVDLEAKNKALDNENRKLRQQMQNTQILQVQESCSISGDQAL